ncbi:copper chaperone PCu(A)C [Mesorhizobium sp. YIM 152430]|uniref:copper chaperone PCu(A)C n=1 Tax=Mesorhizobium sp. YIM 152430 TaxID=3031761 RepID=UPI0023DC3A0E|nr:copper chaperone PCu(A)C [Mesorhizobium sp. YIM 152430]MDF1598860.1 copper chaperone PCu(A)C [Mesorhizobium sp. YIM 152430]
MKFVPLRLIAAACLALSGLCRPAFASDVECLEGQVFDVAGCVDLDTVMAEDLQLSGAWVRAMQPGQKVAAAYLTILNRGETADRLVGATTLAASRVEMHEMAIENGVMEMRPVEGGIGIGPGDRVEFKPAGLHFMLAGIGETLLAEDEIEMTLDFEKAGTVVVQFPVREPATIKAHRH